MAESMLKIADRLAPILLDLWFQSGVVFLFAAIAVAIVRKRTSDAGHGVWRIAGVVVLALPLLSPIFRTKTIAALGWSEIGGEPAFAATSHDIAIDVDRTGAATPIGPREDFGHTHTSAPRPAPVERRPTVVSFGRILVFLWAIGVSVLAARRLRATIRARRLVAAGWPIEGRVQAILRSSAKIVGLGRTPRLVAIEGLAGPATVGVFDPVIVAPIGFLEGLDPSVAKTMLLHELEHVRRRDGLGHVMSTVLRTIFWPQPLTALWASEFERTRELAVDAAVVAHGVSCADYASGLVLAAEGYAMKEKLSAVGAIFSRPSLLRERCDSILSSMRPRRRVSRIGAFAGIAVFGALAVFLPRVTLGSAPQEKEGSATKASAATVKEDSGALDRAAKWFLDHQEKDGSFAVRKKADIGTTALAMYAMLHCIEKGRSPEGLEEAVEKAGNYLVDAQDVDGFFGPRSRHRFTYDLAVSTLALSEAVVKGKSKPRFKAALKSAVAACTNARNPYKGWRYDVRPGDNDSSVTGWMLLALRNAEAAGIEVATEHFTEPLKMVEDLTDPDTGRTGYIKRGELSVRMEGTTEKFPATETEALTALALVVRDSLTARSAASESVVSRAVALCMKRTPRWDTANGTVDMYYWYFGTRALAKRGGDAWNLWRPAILRAAEDNQQKTGADAGSWDPIDPWSEVGDRVYSTAMMTLAVAAAQ